MKRIVIALFLLAFTGCSSCGPQQAELVAAPLVSGGSPCKPMYRPFKPPFRQEMGNGLIVIDPGHGGDDFGTHSLGTPKYQEKYLTLSTAKILKNYLRQLGYTCVMTREADLFIPLDQRAAFANERKPKLFVSVHYNSAPNRKAEGVEIFYFQSLENTKRTGQSKKLAEAILRTMIKETQANSRGVKQGNFAVIRETEMPAVLIEAGFLTNENEMERLKNPSYLKSIAWGIASGIDTYMKGK